MQQTGKKPELTVLDGMKSSKEVGDDAALLTTIHGNGFAVLQDMTPHCRDQCILGGSSRNRQVRIESVYLVIDPMSGAGRWAGAAVTHPPVIVTPLESSNGCNHLIPRRDAFGDTITWWNVPDNPGTE
jgi:hypothetical protein